MKNNVLFVLTILSFLTPNSLFSQERKFCSNNGKDNFEITIYDSFAEDLHKVSYILKNSSGQIIKVINGTWELKKFNSSELKFQLTIHWAGVNAGLPETIFICELDDNNNVIALIENNNLRWLRC